MYSLAATTYCHLVPQPPCLRCLRPSHILAGPARKPLRLTCLCWVPQHQQGPSCNTCPLKPAARLLDGLGSGRA
jgi:hypothetical protein